MEISLTIKEIIPLLDNKITLLTEGIKKRKTTLDKQLSNLKEYIKSVDNYIIEAKRVNYQELIQDFIYVKKVSDTRSKWLFFKEDYIKEEEHLDTYKLESYLQRTFNLSVASLNIVNVYRYGKPHYNKFTTKFGGFYFKAVYYSINYTKDSYHRRIEESSECNHITDNTLHNMQNSLREVLTFQKELLHLQSLFSGDKVITLNERQITLIGE